MGQHDKAADVRRSGDILREEAGRYEARSILARKIGELAVGERLLIWRRREGISQTGAAALLGIHRNKYGEIENGSEDWDGMIPHVGDLYSHEMCFLLRKRSSLTISDCAEEIGVSRYWYNLMELGKASPERLVEYWIEDEG